MGADQDLLFGRIAVARKFCTQEQLDECVSIQARSPDRLPLGQILRSEGYLTDEQHSQILSLQRAQLQAIDPVSKVTKESILLGKLALREKLVTEFQLNVCLRMQARAGEKRSIGEILVAEGYLQPAQVKDLLSRQRKKIMSCAGCRLSFTVLTISDAPSMACPRCKKPLGEDKTSDSVRTDAHLETSTSNKLRKSVQAAAAPKQTSLSSSARLVKMTCPMCEKPFAEPVDSKGRVDCPHCHSSFSA